MRELFGLRILDLDETGPSWVEHGELWWDWGHTLGVSGHRPFTLRILSELWACSREPENRAFWAGCIAAVIEDMGGQLELQWQREYYS